MDKIKYQLDITRIINTAILKITQSLKTVLKECNKDETCLQFTEDILNAMKKYDEWTSKNLQNINFEIQKAKSAKCKNLDEFIKMVFNHE